MVEGDKIIESTLPLAKLESNIRLGLHNEIEIDNENISTEYHNGMMIIEVPYTEIKKTTILAK